MNTPLEPDELRRLLGAATDLLTPQAAPVESLHHRAIIRRRSRLAVVGAAGAVAATVTVVAAVGGAVDHRPMPDQHDVAASSVDQQPKGPEPAGRPDKGEHAETTCLPESMEVALTWRKTTTGRLEGTLSARNSTGHTCQININERPAVTPNGLDGTPLDTDFTQPAMLIVGPPQFVRPGQTVYAEVLWSGWCGSPASHEVEVAWKYPHKTGVRVSGPVQPDCPRVRGAATNMTGGGFGPQPPR